MSQTKKLSTDHGRSELYLSDDSQYECLTEFIINRPALVYDLARRVGPATSLRSPSSWSFFDRKICSDFIVANSSAFRKCFIAAWRWSKSASNSHPSTRKESRPCKQRQRALPGILARSSRPPIGAVEDPGQQPGRSSASVRKNQRASRRDPVPYRASDLSMRRFLSACRGPHP